MQHCAAVAEYRLVFAELCVALRAAAAAAAAADSANAAALPVNYLTVLQEKRQRSTFTTCDCAVVVFSVASQASVRLSVCNTLKSRKP